MEKYIDEKSWKKLFKDYLIVDVALLDKDTIFLCSRKNIKVKDASNLSDFDIPTGFYQINLKNSKEPYSSCFYKGIAFPTVGCTDYPFPLKEGFMINRNIRGEIFSFKNEHGPYEIISESFTEKTIVVGSRLVTLFGYVYAVSAGRQIFKRTGLGTWVLLGKGITYEDDEVYSAGFDDISGFSENDIYAAGGKGDVWHYDGDVWSRLSFPSNEYLHRVCCAGDGWVYIGGAGSLWRGKHNQWERIAKVSVTTNFNDIVWYKEKLFLSSDYFFKFWDGNKLTEVLDKNGEVLSIAGHMDARDDYLVIASSSYVMLFDGTHWSHIVAPYFKK